jgi:hypothetical protein
VFSRFVFHFIMFFFLLIYLNVLTKMLPKDEMYIPPMNIQVLDHRNFGRKPIVGVHVIKSLTKYRVDEGHKEDLIISNIRGKTLLVKL